MAKLNSGTRIYGTATIDGNVTVGSVGAVSGQFHTITGNISQATSGGAVYFNTTGNISAAVANIGILNSTGNILAVGIIGSSASVNGIANVNMLNASGNLSVAGSTALYGNTTHGLAGAVSGQFHTFVGNLTQTSSGGSVYFNTTGNVSAAILTAGQINTTGNILSTGAVYNNVVVNSGNINCVGGYFVGNGAFLSGIVAGGGGGFAGNTSIYVSGTATAIMNGGTTGVGNIGATGATFNTVFAKATTAQYADLAEVYTSDKNYVPGTVLIFGGDQEVTISTISHDPRIAGVVSTNPAYLMNDTETGIAVALTGRVPCQVLGPVAKGDRLVASQWPGIAQKLNPGLYEPGCVIGKALETFEESSVKTIEVVVGRV